jgi:hypothetical protein
MGLIKQVSDSDIFQEYKDVLTSDYEVAFPKNLSEENKDRFYRLKFRALASLVKSN